MQRDLRGAGLAERAGRLRRTPAAAASARSPTCAAVGNPNTGVDIYDSTPEGNGEPTGWTVFGGTSVASPIIAAEFALAGGAGGAPTRPRTCTRTSARATTSTTWSRAPTGRAAARAPARRPSASTARRAWAARSAWSRSRARQPRKHLPADYLRDRRTGPDADPDGGLVDELPDIELRSMAALHASGTGCMTIEGATGRRQAALRATSGPRVRVQEKAANATAAACRPSSAATAVVVSNTRSSTVSRRAPGSPAASCRSKAALWAG